MAIEILLPGPADFSAWRDAARRLLAAGVAPQEVTWRAVRGATGLGAPPPPMPADAPTPRVPRSFIERAEVAITHRAPERFALLYRLLWRLQHGERDLMQRAGDPDVARLEAMVCDASALAQEAPARAAPMAMRRVAPPAARRARSAVTPEHAALPPIPEGGRAVALEELRAAVMADRDTPLAAHATQAVFGEGPLDPPLMLVGEQPGDEEDQRGRPFVGPAGRLLDEVLEEAGVSRPAVYVTNAVKHFKFTQIGKRRLHQTPNAGDIAHYRPFLLREIAIVQPRLILALGGSAAQALLNDQKARVGALRGMALHMPEGPKLRVTVHPSYLLRLPDAVSKARERGRFLEDLRAAAAA